MKITKQRLKEIIKEELENSQNEGMLDRLKAMAGFGHKFWNKHIPQLERDYEEVLSDYPDWESTTNHDYAKKAYYAILDVLPDWDDEARKRIGQDRYQTMNSEQEKQFRAIQKKYRAIKSEMSEKHLSTAKSDDERKQAELALAKDRRREEERAESAKRGASQMAKKDRKDYTKDRPNIAMGFRGDAYSEKERYGESKITKSTLKAIIREELTKAEKKRKKELEKELDTLKHK